MFISSDLVFMELHKTGCTHIRVLLNELLDGEFVGGHNQASSDLFDQGKVFLGSIRDPWEWYLSLWAYGCDKKGAIYNSVTKDRVEKPPLVKSKKAPYAKFISLFANHSKHHHKWLETYNDVNDAEAFRTWLSMMHNPKYRMELREGYGVSSISHTAGLLTFRYLKLFCTKAGELEQLNHLSTPSQIRRYEREFCFINHFIRNECLEEDLFRVLGHFSVDISADKKGDILLREKRNTSSKKHGSAFYYDKKSEKLVTKREQLIIDKFGYIAPSLQQQT